MVKFADIAGLTEAKIEINEFVSYLQNPEKYKVSKPGKYFRMTNSVI